MLVYDYIKNWRFNEGTLVVIESRSPNSCRLLTSNFKCWFCHRPSTMQVSAWFLLGILYAIESVNCKTTKSEVQELKKRLAVVKEETLQETRRITDVRRQEVRILGEQATSCVNSASTELEENVEAELEKRIGPLERELDDGKHEDREELKRKVEAATVGAGAAVEARTLDFVRKANSCNERVTGASFKNRK